MNEEKERGNENERVILERECAPLQRQIASQYTYISMKILKYESAQFRKGDEDKM